jgi:hypothetical protein
MTLTIDLKPEIEQGLLTLAREASRWMTMPASDVRMIYTFNSRDLTRFSELTVVCPQ